MQVIICGAGIAGLTLAGRLDAAGIRVVVLERAPAPRAGGYMLDFFGPGYDAAEAIGVLPRLRELAYPIDEITYCDPAGRRSAGLRIAALAKRTGGRLLSLMRPDLERALRERLSPRVELRYGCAVTAVEDRADGVTVALDSGAAVTADLLVGCDGIHSTVRAAVFGPESRFLRPLGFHTAAYTFADPQAHAAIDGRFCLTDSLHRSMGFYGLRDGRVAVFAVHHSDGAPLPADPRAALRAEYASLGWLVPRALAACPSPEQVYFDEVAQVVAPTWRRGRVVLLGDAAYAVSLLAGQGASLAVAGAYLLGRELARASSVESALVAYEKALRPRVTGTQERARRGVRWFVPRTPTARLLRHAALRAADLPVTGRLIADGLVGKGGGLIADAGPGR